LLTLFVANASNRWHFWLLILLMWSLTIKIYDYQDLQWDEWWMMMILHKIIEWSNSSTRLLNDQIPPQDLLNDEWSRFSIRFIVDDWSRFPSHKIDS